MDSEVKALQKANRILEIKNASSLANNLCPDHRDKQTGKSCLACEIEHLTALASKQMAKNIKESAVVLRQQETIDSLMAQNQQWKKENSALNAEVKKSRELCAELVGPDIGKKGEGK